MDTQTQIYDLIEANQPIHEILATLSKEQLTDVFELARSKVLNVDPNPFASIFTDAFDWAKPPDFCFHGLDGEVIYSQHPIVEYIIKVISPIQKREQRSKQVLAKKVEDTIQAFVVLEESSLLEIRMQNYERHLLTPFEEHMRTIALQLFQKVLATKEANDARREERTEKRKELYNLRRRVKRAEHNLAWATENVNRLREEQHKSAEYLLSLVD